MSDIEQKQANAIKEALTLIGNNVETDGEHHLREMVFDVTVALHYGDVKAAREFFKVDPEWIEELIHRGHIQDE